jgi:hypothetical protein
LFLSLTNDARQAARWDSRKLNAPGLLRTLYRMALPNSEPGLPNRKPVLPNQKPVLPDWNLF